MVVLRNICLTQPGLVPTNIHQHTTYLVQSAVSKKFHFWIRSSFRTVDLIKLSERTLKFITTWFIPSRIGLILGKVDWKVCHLATTLFPAVPSVLSNDPAWPVRHSRPNQSAMKYKAMQLWFGIKLALATFKYFLVASEEWHPSLSTLFRLDMLRFSRSSNLLRSWTRLPTTHLVLHVDSLVSTRQSIFSISFAVDKRFVLWIETGWCMEVI